MSEHHQRRGSRDERPPLPYRSQSDRPDRYVPGERQPGRERRPSISSRRPSEQGPSRSRASSHSGYYPYPPESGRPGPTLPPRPVPFGEAVLRILGCTSVLSFEGFLHAVGNGVRVDESFVWLETAAISIEPPTRFRPNYHPSHLVTPDYLTILSPSLSESLSAFSASVRVDVDMHVERIDLSPSTHLTIDNVSGLVSELAHSDPTSTPTALCNNFAWLTHHHRQPVRLYAKNLLLRPVVMKQRDRLEVHFEFRAAALSTAMKLCESGEVRKLR